MFKEREFNRIFYNGCTQSFYNYRFYMNKSHNKMKMKNKIWHIIYYQLIKRHYFGITSSIRVLPDFLIIGAKRCGTTSLFTYLPEHPSIIESHHDNMGFFNDNYHLGVNWYKSFFTTISTKKRIEKEQGKCLSFDVTTRYIEQKSTAENIKKIKPDMKIIVILRNPIDRAYSQFNLSKKELTQSLDFESEVFREITELEKKMENNNELEFNKEKQHYIQRGLYAKQLKSWFEIFPRDNILILSTEDFKNDNNMTYSKIFDFLDIPEHSINKKEMIGKGEYEPMKETARKMLIEFYKKHNEDLFKLIGKKFDWNS